MRHFRKEILSLLFIVFLSVNAACQVQKGSVSESDTKVEKQNKKKKKYKLPKIDLSHWSVTTPELNEKGSALSVQPPDILHDQSLGNKWYLVIIM